MFRHVLMLSVLLLVGCDSSPPEPEPVPVSGRLVLQNGSTMQPMVDVTVHFIPDDSSLQTVSDVTDGNGYFNLEAAPGFYRVIVELSPSASVPLPDPSYGNVNDTPFTVEVTEGGVSGLVLTMQ